MSETIAIVNQKGGTGKTTTTVNLGSVLSKKGFKVLLVDMDPQGNLSYSLAINELQFSILDALLQKVAYDKAIVQREGLDVLPANTELSKLELGAYEQSMFMLGEVLAANTDYDFVLIDCPPSFSVLTTNALLASDYVLVPMQLDVFSVEGLRQIVNTVEYINTTYQHNLEILGVLPVMVDNRKKLTTEVLDYVKETFEMYVFENYIRTNVKAAEAPSFGCSVIDYAPQSNSALDYQAAADELTNTYTLINKELTN